MESLGYSCCFNCSKDNKSLKLSQCSKCKVAMYCSNVCQNEHWLTTHKKHCKYLAGEVKFPGWEEHNPRTCHTCMDVKMKPEKYREEQSEYMLCVRKGESFLQEHFSLLLGGGTGSLELPFSLGEMSGTYLDIADELLSAEAALLENILFRNNGDRAQAVKELLWDVQLARVAHWIGYIRGDYGGSRLVSQMLFESVKKVDRLLGHKQTSDSVVVNQVNCWHTFQLVWSNIMRGQLYEDHLRQGIISDELAGKFGTSDKQWGKVEVFHSNSGAVKVKAILNVKEELALHGGKEAECSSCYRKVDLSAAHLICDSAKHVTAKLVKVYDEEAATITSQIWSPLAVFQDKRMDQPFILVLNFGMKMFVSCGGEMCKVATAVAAFGGDFKLEDDRPSVCGIRCAFRWAFCHKLSHGTHRCSKCLSKLYCSAECLAKDWEKVHRKVCQVYKEDGTHVALGSRGRGQRGQRLAEATSSL
eukprot:GFUD01109681.1.p1 GENE.GFUD01109681.1~~GFUD01109681.1.p1  ORF type:complete len:473 (-),score=97.23 GFUD01109681.1:35-1453(-)